jgi:hypothetical protein
VGWISDGNFAFTGFIAEMGILGIVVRAHSARRWATKPDDRRCCSTSGP